MYSIRTVSIYKLKQFVLLIIIITIFIFCLYCFLVVNFLWQLEKEKLRKKILGLERQLDKKQGLELEVERMKGALQVMKHMSEDKEIKIKMDEIEETLKDKEEELENEEALHQALVVKERKCNDELQEARKELINVCTSLFSYI